MARWFEDGSPKGKTMKYAAMIFLSVLCSGCIFDSKPDGMALMFASYSASPTLVTHFAIEGPLGEIPRQIAGSGADTGTDRSGGSTALISAPIDVGNDDLWHLSTQWVELPTDKAWRAEVDIPIDKLTISGETSYRLNVIFGPNGLLLIGSDIPSTKMSDHIDVVRICGQRVPEADEAWRLNTGYFPEMPIIMKDLPPVKNPECPFPKR